MNDDEAWYDEDAGPLIRPYTITRGRTRADGHDLDLITMVVATGLYPATLDPDYAAVVAVCELAQSVAEISARTKLPLGVAKILISDLIDANCLMFRSAPSVVDPDIDMLRKVLEGIRRL
ncbi:multi-component regulatory system-11 [Alloactinosynnema sp. L-07]|uniref:DUF742 domain-containing protein n=1 Tax=Alloactinosynnema sp. L-07 TaxID=1653480 RepID=UPI00065EF619|nr:DUF742 domain-containing protein [Alloactinosynnema sp. L-07]CRK57939.1 multi-component regulatory system-11 [Alloactinosynnema sp. L-07]